MEERVFFLLLDWMRGETFVISGPRGARLRSPERLAWRRWRWEDAIAGRRMTRYSMYHGGLRRDLAS